MSNKRLEILDVFRGLAVLFVALFHYTTKYSEIFKDDSTIQLFDFSYGGTGVSFFFIISGFVIFFSIQNITDYKLFLKKRFLRLFPIFWICITITFLATSISQIPRLQRGVIDFIFNFTMIPGLLGFERIDAAYWSLVPELFFYVFTAILISFKNDKKYSVALVIWFLIFVINVYLENKYLKTIFNLKYGHLFLIGVNFYWLKFKNGGVLNHLFIIILVFIGFVYSHNTIKSLIMILYVICFYLFVYNKLNFFNVKILKSIGKVSYSFYLLHQFIGYIIINHLIIYNIKNPLLLLFIPLFTVFGLTYLLTYKVEVPMLSYLKKRLL